jgi:hypothetical protein
VIDPQTAFEKMSGKKEHFESPEQWEKEFYIFFSGWKSGFEYAVEIKQIENDMRALSDLQRGVG